MNQSNQNVKKTKPKTQSKIHRRKNQQIPKQFFCTIKQCQKAYGSYAALYTHMKNKHEEVKPPTMPNTVAKQKNSHPGRPKVKKNQNEKVQQHEADQVNQQQIVCKVCLKQECECLQSYDSQQKKKTIQIMSCQKFTSFTNQVGQLGNDDISWVRRTQQQFIFKSQDKIIQQIEEFNRVHNLSSTPSQKLIEYLSFSSKFWDPQNIDELYSSIYAMIAFQNHQACIKFLMESDFSKIQDCIRKSPNQFKRLESVVRII